MRILVLLMLLAPLTSYGGAWVVGSFENDDALDWVGSLSGQTSSVVKRALAVSDKGYLEVDTCSVAIAAADIVASARTNSFDHLPDEVTSWISSNKRELQGDTLVSTALVALGRCAGERSEIAELWGDAMPEQCLKELINRLILDGT